MNDNIPIYKKVKLSIKDKIDNDEFLAGEAILSERELAKLYGVNRMTIKKAIQSLIEDGILYSVPGSGTYVCSEHKNFMVGIFDDKTFSSISTRLNASGINSYSKVINKSTFNGYSSISSKLNIPKDKEIFSLTRQRLNQNKEIIALEYFYTPKNLFPDIAEYDFSRVSLYDYMQKKNLKPSFFDRKLTIIPASNSLAEMLNVKKNHFVYCFEFIGFSKENQIVE
ncbi:MAG: GntR family transcriptional regulator, partial [Clostridium paraputrificum]